MRRIWMEPEFIQEPEFNLSDEAFHHAILVSRFSNGDEFELVSGQCEALRVQLVEVKKKSARVKIVARRSLPPLKKPYVGLAFAISKWSTFEAVLEKSVELGVHAVLPLLTDHSFIKTKKEWASNRLERFQKIIKGATEQCGRGELMKLQEPLSLREFIEQLNRKPKAAGLFAYEGPSALAIKTELQRVYKNHPEEIWAVVGSEGGFSEAEVAYMRAQNLPPITLGSQILRAETACFAMVSVIKYETELFS